MTIEAYNTATEIMKKVKTLDDSIYVMEALQLKDTEEWLMEIRPNNSHPLMKIDHKGLLPEFLDAVLVKLREERAELNRELDKL
ncbi:MAG: hypothetical protein IKC03_09850 [Oscillospiraceae bacterium]|nr:hypothetical protein [Oscillospiraceae bacterium]